MKKVLLLLIPALLIGFAGCKKEQEKDKEKEKEKEEIPTGLVVEKKQRSVVSNLSATWCGPCGAFGGPAFKTAAQELGTNELIPLNIQGSGSSKLLPLFMRPGVDSIYIVPVQSMMFSSLNIQTNANGSFGIPSFSMNNNFLGTSNVTAALIKSNATSFNSNSPVVGVVAKKKIEGNKITVNAKCKFFENAEGEYHWVAFVIEKKVKGIQAVNGVGQVPDYEHQYMVRASMQDGEMHDQKIWGTNAFASGSISSGKEFEKTFTLNYVKYDFPANYGLIDWNLDNDNTGIAIMVWKKTATPNKYEFVNGFFAE